MGLINLILQTLLYLYSRLSQLFCVRSDRGKVRQKNRVFKMKYKFEIKYIIRLAIREKIFSTFLKLRKNILRYVTLEINLQ